MLIKALGILNIVIAIIFWIFGFLGIIPRIIIWIFALYLLIKGIFFIFWMSFSSIVYIVSSLIMFASIYWRMPQLIVVIVTVILIGKGIYDLI